MATNWKNKLRVADVFHNDDYTLQQKRDIIVKRVRKASWYNENDDELFEAVSLLEEAQDEEEFNEAWAALYDWADQDHRLWIVTR